MYVLTTYSSLLLNYAKGFFLLVKYQYNKLLCFVNLHFNSFFLFFIKKPFLVLNIKV